MPPNLHRRQYARVTISVPVNYAPDGQLEQRSGGAVDLGAGGMRLASTEHLATGTIIALRFRLPTGDREIQARGRVLLSFFSGEERRYHHGIAFTAIDPDDKKLLEDFVDEQISA